MSTNYPETFSLDELREKAAFSRAKAARLRRVYPGDPEMEELAQQADVIAGGWDKRADLLESDG